MLALKKISVTLYIKVSLLTLVKYINKLTMNNTSTEFINLMLISTYTNTLRSKVASANIS